MPIRVIVDCALRAFGFLVISPLLFNRPHFDSVFRKEGAIVHILTEFHRNRRGRRSLLNPCRTPAEPLLSRTFFYYFFRLYIFCPFIFSSKNFFVWTNFRPFTFSSTHFAYVH